MSVFDVSRDFELLVEKQVKKIIKNKITFGEFKEIYHWVYQEGSITRDEAMKIAQKIAASCRSSR
jgi:hypothetical protein